MKIAQLVLLAIIACGLCACGNRGKLKSPTQIQAAEAKKKAKAERQGNDDDDDSESLMLMQTEVKQPNTTPEETHSPLSTPSNPEAK